MGVQGRKGVLRRTRKGRREAGGLGPGLQELQSMWTREPGSGTRSLGHSPSAAGGTQPRSTGAAPFFPTQDAENSPDQRQSRAPNVSSRACRRSISCGGKGSR